MGNAPSSAHCGPICHMGVQCVALGVPTGAAYGHEGLVTWALVSPRTDHRRSVGGWGGQPGSQEGSSTHRPHPGTRSNLEGETVLSAPAGPPGLCKGSRAHGCEDAAAAGTKTMLGLWHQGLTFILEVPILCVPTACSKQTRGARAALGHELGCSEHLRRAASSSSQAKLSRTEVTWPRGGKGSRRLLTLPWHWQQRQNSFGANTNPVSKPCPEHPPRGGQERTRWKGGEKWARGPLGTRCQARPRAQPLGHLYAVPSAATPSPHRTDPAPGCSYRAGAGRGAGSRGSAP